MAVAGALLVALMMLLLNIAGRSEGGLIAHETETIWLKPDRPVKRIYLHNINRTSPDRVDGRPNADRDLVTRYDGHVIGCSSMGCAFWHLTHTSPAQIEVFEVPLWRIAAIIPPDRPVRPKLRR